MLLGNDKKTFVVFVGFYEAAALIREINGETPARPLTHELIQNVFLGFNVEIKSVIISSIIENTFCATLILEQTAHNGTEESAGKRNEVRIDARPSDCLILALKNNVDILVTDEVFTQVQDVSKMTVDLEDQGAPGVPSLEDFEFEISSKLENFDPDPDLGEFGELGEVEDDDEEDEDSGDEFGGGSFRGGP